MTDSAEVEILDEDECWRLLGTAELGRVAVTDGEELDIFPINFIVTGRGVFFRSAPGTKIVELTQHPAIAFEADGYTDRHRWSVVVRGRTRRLNLESEIVESGVQRLRSMSPTEKWNFFEITPSSVTGRRFADDSLPITVRRSRTETDPSK